jgi:hypothetical protein
MKLQIQWAKNYSLQLGTGLLSKMRLLFDIWKHFFLGRAPSEKFFEHITRVLDNAKLPLKRLLMVSSDGPNVNVKVHRLLTEHIKNTTNRKQLLDLGFCNIHVIHNAFIKGIKQMGDDASTFIVSHLHPSPAARQFCRSSYTITDNTIK